MSLQMTTMNDFRNYLGFLVLCAPDRFPKVGPFGDSRKENLTIAFGDLRAGLPLAEKKIQDQKRLSQIEKLIDLSFNAYTKGDVVQGVRHLQDLETVLFPERIETLPSKKATG